MLKTHKIEGYIYLKSGLRIGGNKDTMQIGGIDSPVIKNPLTDMPYIPGSSIKGKVRSLLENFYGLENSSKVGAVPSINNLPKNDKYSDWKENKVAIIFGHLDHKADKPSYPTRVIFRDCDIVGALEANTQVLEENINRDIAALIDKMSSNFSEAKTEVSIDRLSGTVGSGHAPRTIERIPAGVVFDFSIILRSFVENEELEFLPILKKGLRLLENDALGGSGSRGYGRVQFFGLKENGVAFTLNDA